MKFILLTLEYPPFKGGVANYYHNLVKHAPKEHEVVVLHNNEGRLAGGIFSRLKALRKELKVKSEKLKVHVIAGQILPLGTVAWLLSFVYKFNYTVVLHGQDLEYAKRHWRKKWLAGKILKKAGVIICNSTYVAGRAEEFIGKEYNKKIKVVNPGVERMWY